MQCEICESHIVDACSKADSCPALHHAVSYQWQVRPNGDSPWVNLLAEDNVNVETQYCQPISVKIFQQITLQDRSLLIGIQCDKMDMRAQLRDGNVDIDIEIRRLATPSYAMKLLESVKGNEEAHTAGFFTQWRWYFEEGGTWKEFEADGLTPAQSTIEMKYLAGQEVFRFVLPSEKAHPKSVYFINFLNFKTHKAGSQNASCIRRRPLFVNEACLQSKVSLPFPAFKPSPHLPILPQQWFPPHTQDDFELVPLNPESMDYHLVMGEMRNLPGRQVADIFRVQNPFLWQKYESKKMYMKQHNKDQLPEERLLFHGTSQTEVVQAILRQNFDWRVAGKNATLYGLGSYFAATAVFSDKYTGKPPLGTFRWMFMARVLVGRSARGQKDFQRPPPLDTSNPYGELFDSCVDNEHRPSIYVIFDNDQAYPEFLISYT